MGPIGSSVPQKDAGVNARVGNLKPPSFGKKVRQAVRRVFSKDSWTRLVRRKKRTTKRPSTPLEVDGPPRTPILEPVSETVTPEDEPIVTPLHVPGETRSTRPQTDTPSGEHAPPSTNDDAMRKSGVKSDNTLPSSLALQSAVDMTSPYEPLKVPATFDPANQAQAIRQSPKKDSKRSTPGDMFTGSKHDPLTQRGIYDLAQAKAREALSTPAGQSRSAQDEQATSTLTGFVDGSETIGSMRTGPPSYSGVISRRTPSTPLAGVSEEASYIQSEISEYMAAGLKKLQALPEKKAEDRRFELDKAVGKVKDAFMLHGISIILDPPRVGIMDDLKQTSPEYIDMLELFESGREALEKAVTLTGRKKENALAEAFDDIHRAFQKIEIDLRKVSVGAARVEVLDSVTVLPATAADARPRESEDRLSLAPVSRNGPPSSSTLPLNSPVEPASANAGPSRRNEHLRDADHDSDSSSRRSPAAKRLSRSSFTTAGEYASTVHLPSIVATA